MGGCVVVPIGGGRREINWFTFEYALAPIEAFAEVVLLKADVICEPTRPRTANDSRLTRAELAGTQYQRFEFDSGCSLLRE